MGRLLRLVAAVVLTAATGLVVAAAPASAATCSSSSGVSVVVDFHELGGGIRTGCVAGGGGDSASALFPAAGISLSYVQRQPGFVCQVAGAPSDSPCVSTPPTNAYWGLWWSDGRSGSWTYATTSVGGLHVPDGGYVAFSWNGSSARSVPGVGPAPHLDPSPTSEPRPTKTPKPTHPSQTGTSPTQAPGGTAGDQSPAGSAIPSTDPTTRASAKPGRTAGTKTGDKTGDKAGKQAGEKAGEKAGGKHSGPADPSTSVAPSTADDPDLTHPTSAEPADPGGGLPSWIAPVVIVVLFGAVGGVAVVRRRRSTLP